jgi:hypothetical protein
VLATIGSHARVTARSAVPTGRKSSAHSSGGAHSAAGAGVDAGGGGGGGSSLPSVVVVDFWVLSDGAIHNKFDKASVNDPDVGIHNLHRNCCSTLQRQLDSPLPILRT